MDKNTIQNLINSKMKEFDYLFKQVQAFKHRKVNGVDFPDYGDCKNDVQMNRLLSFRRNELFSLANQLV